MGLCFIVYSLSSTLKCTALTERNQAWNLKDDLHQDNDGRCISRTIKYYISLKTNTRLFLRK